MILLTIGTQLPFDRLVHMTDMANQKLELDIFAQIGNSSFEPLFIKHKQFCTPDEIDEKIEKSEFIISHAGMGTIITAIKKKKPIIIVPRKASLKEHRNDHQIDTIKSFAGVKGVYPVNTYEELYSHLEKKEMLERPTGMNSPHIQTLVDYINLC